jgi:hypothetical protein
MYGGSLKPQRHTPPVTEKVTSSRMYDPPAAQRPEQPHSAEQPMTIVRPAYETQLQPLLRGSSHENTPPGSTGDPPPV